MIDNGKSYRVSCAIVIYNNEYTMLKGIINSFLATKVDVRLYLVDNSPTDKLRDICSDNRCNYIHNPSNPGFGVAHNIAIKKAIEDGSNYHFIMNPDVHFSDDVIITMVDYINEDPHIGMLMPEVLNWDGSVQNLPKLLPNPLSIILRKLKRPRNLYKKFINKYELRFVKRDVIYNTPILSGCFTLLNLKAVQEIGGYDDAFFMYFEDWDLSRRMTQKYK